MDLTYLSLMVIMHFNKNILITAIFQSVCIVYMYYDTDNAVNVFMHTHTAAQPTNVSGFMDMFAYYRNVRCNGTENNPAECLGLQPEMASIQPCLGFTAGVRCVQSKSF